MEQQPHQREFIEQATFEDLIQRYRHVGRFHQGRVVVQQPQAGAIAEHPPVGTVVGIEALLQAELVSE